MAGLCILKTQRKRNWLTFVSLWIICIYSLSVLRENYCFILQSPLSVFDFFHSCFLGFSRVPSLLFHSHLSFMRLIIRSSPSNQFPACFMFYHLFLVVSVQFIFKVLVFSSALLHSVCSILLLWIVTLVSSFAFKIKTLLTSFRLLCPAFWVYSIYWLGKKAYWPGKLQNQNSGLSLSNPFGCTLVRTVCFMSKK